MATYKVIQDIESEDKLVGPLTFRQFVYAGLAALNFYLTFLVISKGAPFMAMVFFPVGGLCAFFAWPWSRDQPTEVWALAKIRFMLKPRRRIWNQSGMKELVTITAPKKIERTLTNGLSQNEVRSRLHALAETIDSRGWAIKNVNVGVYGQAAVASAESDRLVSASSLPQPVPTIDIRATDDMLDVQNNPVAQQFDSMIAASTKAHRQKIMDQMQQSVAPTPPPPPQPAQQQQPAQSNNYWFLNQPAQSGAVVPQDTVTFNTQVVAPGASVSDLPVSAAVPTRDEEEFIKSHKNEPAFSPNMHGHLHVVQPLSAQQGQSAQSSAPQQSPFVPSQPAVGSVPQSFAPTPVMQMPGAAPAPAAITATPRVTPAPDTAILDLARNDDLNVATIAREAQKRKEPLQDEVVISLH